MLIALGMNWALLVNNSLARKRKTFSLRNHNLTDCLGMIYILSFLLYQSFSFPLGVHSKFKVEDDEKTPETMFWCISTNSNLSRILPLHCGK